MAFWILDQWDGGTLDYPTLGFIAEVGDILSATAAPDPRWSSTGSGPETVQRYTVGSDPSYVEPGEGHVLTWSDADNAYVPTAPSTFRGTFSVLDYGADPTGVADSTAAIQAAIDAVEAIGGGVVYLPRGDFKVSSTLTINSSGVRLVGAGFTGPTGGGSYPTWLTPTMIEWAGGASPVIQATFVQGIAIEELGIDGGATASQALHLDAVQNSTFRRVGIRNLEPLAGIAIYATTTQAVANIGTQHNLFQQIRATTPTFLYATGNQIDFTRAAAPDFTTNTVDRCTCNFGSTSNATGVVLDIADNNVFTGLHLFRAAGTGYAVDFKDAARHNVFLWLGSAAGIIARTPLTSTMRNTIFYLDRSNGAPDPVEETGAKLVWTEDGVNSAGWRVDGFARSFGVGHNAPSPVNSGTTVHVKTTDGTTPEVRVHGTAASTTALFESSGRTAASAEVRARFGAVSTGVGEVNVVTAHPLLFRTNNTERMRILSTGGIVLGSGGTGPQIHQGAGTPEGAVAAPIGSTYHRTDGGAGTSFYVKESGTGNTGWVAK